MNIWSPASHVADVLQPVAAVFGGQEESDASASLPAAADLSEPPGHAGHKERQAAQQHRHGEQQNQDEGGGEVEAVLGCIEGAIPAVEQRVEGGHEQGAVA